MATLLNCTEMRIKKLWAPTKQDKRAGYTFLLQFHVFINTIAYLGQRECLVLSMRKRIVRYYSVYSKTYLLFQIFSRVKFTPRVSVFT
jgi:hypothetical protein